MLLLLLVGHRKFKFWKESLCLRQKWWSRCLKSSCVFHLTVDILLLIFFHLTVDMFFHLTLIFFFSTKSCGFQFDCLRCCLSDGLRCFAFRWLRALFWQIFKVALFWQIFKAALFWNNMTLKKQLVYFYLVMLWLALKSLKRAIIETTCTCYTCHDNHRNHKYLRTCENNHSNRLWFESSPWHSLQLKVHLCTYENFHSITFHA